MSKTAGHRHKPKSNRLMDILDGPWGVSSRHAESKPKRMPRPTFTDEELRCIHKEITTIAWQREEFYDARRTLIAKLDAYFGGPVQKGR